MFLVLLIWKIKKRRNRLRTGLVFLKGSESHVPPAVCPRALSQAPFARSNGDVTRCLGAFGTVWICLVFPTPALPLFSRHSPFRSCHKSEKRMSPPLDLGIFRSGSLCRAGGLPPPPPRPAPASHQQNSYPSSGLTCLSHGAKEQPLGPCGQPGPAAFFLPVPSQVDTEHQLPGQGGIIYTLFSIECAASI